MKSLRTAIKQATKKLEFGNHRATKNGFSKVKDV